MLHFINSPLLEENSLGGEGMGVWEVGGWVIWGGAGGTKWKWGIKTCLLCLVISPAGIQTYLLSAQR